MRRLLTIMALLPLLCLQAQADNINLKDLSARVPIPPSASMA